MKKTFLTLSFFLLMAFLTPSLASAEAALAADAPQTGGGMIEIEQTGAASSSASKVSASNTSQSSSVKTKKLAQAGPTENLIISLLLGFAGYAIIRRYSRV